MSASTKLAIIHLNWNLILEYVKVLVWPLVVSGFIFYFKKNIADLIDRITIIKGPGGTELRAEQQQKVEDQKEGIDELSKTDIASNLQPQIEKIRGEYEKELSDEKKANKNKEEVINNLLEQLSLKSLRLDFEIIYRLIFGSQIDLLKRLRLKENSGEEAKDEIFFFALSQRIFPIFENWTFSQYLKFLFDTGLIYIKSDLYFISDKGKAFLFYIEILNYPKKDL